jgi:chromosome segregation ATPase
MITHYERSQT